MVDKYGNWEWRDVEATEHVCVCLLYIYRVYVCVCVFCCISSCFPITQLLEFTVFCNECFKLLYCRGNSIHDHCNFF